MDTHISKWTLLATGPVAWMVVGAFLAVFLSWCYRQYGKEVAFRSFVRVHQIEPLDMNAVDTLFAKSHRTLISVSEDSGHFRYRFSGGAEIDVVTKRDGRVLTINPTFAHDGLGLLWLFHRNQLSIVRAAIPLDQDSGTVTFSYRTR